MSLLGGVFADRFDRRLAIATAEIGIGIVALLTAVLVASDRLGLIGLVALAFAGGTLGAIEHPIDRAFIADLAGDDLEHAIAFSSLEFSLARTAQPRVTIEGPAAAVSPKPITIPGSAIPSTKAATSHIASAICIRASSAAMHFVIAVAQSRSR